jgi:hypothetical protein
MVELKKIETKDEGGLSFVTLCLEPICLPNEPCLQDTHLCLHRASTGSRRMDLNWGGILA